MTMIVAVTLKEMAQKAFAVAISQFCSGMFPDADRVEFSVGTNECRYITDDGLTTFIGTYYSEGSICIEVVEDHSTTTHSSNTFPYSWHHIFSVFQEYDSMKGREILEWTSDQNLQHMRQMGDLDYIVDLLIVECSAETFPYGTTKEAVSNMTPFEVIEFLERLNTSTDHSGVEPGIMCVIGQFLEEVDDKNGFRTADDK